MTTVPADPADRWVAGSYGLRITGLPGASDLLGRVRADAPALHLSLLPGAGSNGAGEVGLDRASLLLRDGSRFDVDRVSARAVLTTSQDLTQDDLVHPSLAPAAALVQQWHGREALHAGAFLVDGEAVLVLADKEGGKSSTLGHLAMEEGVAVLADDLAILDGDRVLAGPRCLDLRPLTAQTYADRWQGRLVRSGSRTRLELSGALPDAGLGAGVVLAWG
ncbi:MAG: hypothetical protein H7233_04755, partial [Pseudorhodobacter sp.]|nr:hypothetical protein [Frankiaceae bacterium]